MNLIKKINLNLDLRKKKESIPKIKKTLNSLIENIKFEINEKNIKNFFENNINNSNIKEILKFLINKQYEKQQDKKKMKEIYKFFFDSKVLKKSNIKMIELIIYILNNIEIADFSKSDFLLNKIQLNFKELSQKELIEILRNDKLCYKFGEMLTIYLLEQIKNKNILLEKEEKEQLLLSIFKIKSQKNGNIEEPSYGINSIYYDLLISSKIKLEMSPNSLTKIIKELYHNNEVINNNLKIAYKKEVFEEKYNYQYLELEYLKVIFDLNEDFFQENNLKKYQNPEIIENSFISKINKTKKKNLLELKLIKKELLKYKKEAWFNKNQNMAKVKLKRLIDLIYNTYKENEKIINEIIELYVKNKNNTFFDFNELEDNIKNFKIKYNDEQITIKKMFLLNLENNIKNNEKETIKIIDESLIKIYLSDNDICNNKEIYNFLIIYLRNNNIREEKDFKLFINKDNILKLIDKNNEENNEENEMELKKEINDNYKMYSEIFIKKIDMIYNQSINGNKIFKLILNKIFEIEEEDKILKILEKNPEINAALKNLEIMQYVKEKKNKKQKMF
jgi:hypothetical protein